MLMLNIFRYLRKLTDEETELKDKQDELEKKKIDLELELKTVVDDIKTCKDKLNINLINRKMILKFVYMFNCIYKTR